MCACVCAEVQMPTYDIASVCLSFFNTMALITKRTFRRCLRALTAARVSYAHASEICRLNVFPMHPHPHSQTPTPPQQILQPPYSDTTKQSDAKDEALSLSAAVNFIEAEFQWSKVCAYVQK